MQGTNILGCLENDYRAKMTDGQTLKDSRIETNIVGVTSVLKFLAGNNIQPVGGTDGDGVTNTQEFFKDVDTHIIKLLTVEVLGDKPEIIMFHVILDSNVPPILGSHYRSPQHKMFRTIAVSNKEYIEKYTLTTATYSLDR